MGLEEGSTGKGFVHAVSVSHPFGFVLGTDPLADLAECQGLFASVDGFGFFRWVSVDLDAEELFPSVQLGLLVGQIWVVPEIDECQAIFGDYLGEDVGHGRRIPATGNKDHDPTGCGIPDSFGRECERRH
jgi:hypothetical protein